MGYLTRCQSNSRSFARYQGFLLLSHTLYLSLSPRWAYVVLFYSMSLLFIPFALFFFRSRVRRFCCWLSSPSKFWNFSFSNNFSCLWIFRVCLQMLILSCIIPAWQTTTILSDVWLDFFCLSSKHTYKYWHASTRVSFSFHTNSSPSSL